ncbi:MAG: hypothetical protein FWD38_06135 [Oscillospiraceae bacterium]|nr:hypothetical protein [Oscillospiraceae bacterium]
MLESGHNFSSDICTDSIINDLDTNAINIFREKWHGHSGNERLTNLADEQLLIDCGAITDKGVTYAALILFGKQEIIQKKLHHAEVIFEYRPKEAAGPAAQREEFGAGFYIYYDRIWELVNLHNDDQYYTDGFYKHSVKSYYEDVVRESLLNAVSHRDYRLGGGIFIRQYQSRLVIESPGGLPHGITIENILNRQNARNKLIADIFKLCGLVERSGQGMNLIYESAIKNAKPLPDFNGSDMYFVMLTLTGQVISTDMLSYIKKIDEERLNKITMDDYLLLVSLFTQKGLASIDITQFEHLVELEIVRITGDSTELVNGEKVFVIENQSAVNRRSIGSKHR